MAAEGINSMVLTANLDEVACRERPETRVCPIVGKNHLTHFAAPQPEGQFRLAGPYLSIPCFRFIHIRRPPYQLSYLQTSKMLLRVDVPEDEKERELA